MYISVRLMCLFYINFASEINFKQLKIKDYDENINSYSDGAVTHLRKCCNRGKQF